MIAQATRHEVGSRRWRRWRATWLILAGLAVALMWGSVTVGVGSLLVSPSVIWRGLWEPADVTRVEAIAVHARAARVVLAFGVGGALGAAGALLQALFRNPLASPEVTGVTQGAAAATVGFITFGPVLGPSAVLWVLPAIAAGGGFLAGSLVWGVARLAGRVDPTRLILTGVLVGGVFSAVTSVSLLRADDTAQELMRWLAGSLALRSWTHVQQFLVGMAVAVPLTVLAVARANAMQLGNQVAASLGLRLEASRLLILLAAATLTASAVCTAGGVGFVGLVAPHMFRRWVGGDLRRLVPAAALGGGLLVMLADLLSRNLLPAPHLVGLGLPVESVAFPVGIYLALLGVPFFLVLLRRMT